MKPATPQRVSAALRYAGHKRAESRPGRIKGFREYSEGYLVMARQGYAEASVLVEHETGMDRGEAAARRRAGAVDRYAATLEAKGYTVKHDVIGLLPVLMVTAGES